MFAVMVGVASPLHANDLYQYDVKGFALLLEGRSLQNLFASSFLEGCFPL